MLRYLTPLFVLLSCCAQAQISHGGNPINWGHSAEDRSSLPALTLDTLDVDAVLAATDTSGAELVYRFGDQRMLEVDLMTQGEWSEMADGGRVCRFTLRSPGAVMMSVQFSSFHPAWGAQLFVYDEERTQFLGAFNTQNQRPDGLFATAFVPGDAVTIEYQEPAGAPLAQLQVSSITHAWQSIFPPSEGAQRDIDPGYQSAPCHNNVVCPIGDDWQDQNRSVIWFVMPSGIGCNGTLLNNTAEDGTPYLLIANHCYQPTESQWVFYFNYQSPTCVGNVGPTSQTMTGSVRRSVDYYKDFCLMELNEAPPSDFNVYYAGWDHSGAAPQSGANISNPLSDVKKISLYDTPATTSTANGGVECWRMFWTTGLLQAGASGSPLFDQNGRVVAHMIDGRQECDNATTSPSFGSKFSNNWNGASPGVRLRDWLDPANSTVALNGFSPTAAHVYITVKLKVMLQGAFNPSAGIMSSALNTAGLLPLTEPYTALGYVHHGQGGGEITTSEVLAGTGENQVVDWVVVELRNKNYPASVLATRAALLLRNGTIVDVDGVNDVSFVGPGTDQYYVAVQHRNHLGIMTAAPQALSPEASLIDLTNGSVGISGGSDATTSINGVRCLFAGDVNMNGVIKYTGDGNDRDPILTRVGGAATTGDYIGYAAEDVNMSGVVKYTGANNDRDALLLNLGSEQNAVRVGHLP